MPAFLSFQVLRFSLRSEAENEVFALKSNVFSVPLFRFSTTLANMFISDRLIRFSSLKSGDLYRLPPRYLF